MFSRNAILSTTAILAACTATAPAFAQVRSFDIPAQTAVKAIPEFARQAQIQVIASARDLAGVRTPAIKGAMDVRQALHRLIAGTALEIASDDGQVITLRSRRAPGHNAAQVSGRGTVAGQVANTTSGDYLRAAIVELVAANGERRSATSGEGGAYRFNDVPAGPARVSVHFTGYATEEADVQVQPRKTAKLDFSLSESGADGEQASNRIVVNGAREDYAQEIMQQRKSMNIVDVLSTDAYGDIAGGNPAEFLKFMPGIDVDGTNGSSLYAFLRGLPAEYTRTQLNGMDVVSANANAPSGYANSAAAARIFSYESISMSAIDSVTVYKTVSADNNADAPAGIIDLRTKHAYDRKKQALVISVGGFSHENMLDGTIHTGPDPRGYGKDRFLPEASFFYANSFFNRRLGVMLSLGYNNSYIEREQLTMSRNYVPTAKSPDPLAFTSMEFETSARQTTRRTASTVIDFKVDDRLTVSLLGIAYRGNVYQNQSDATFTTGARTNGVSGDILSDYTTLNPATTKTFQAANSTQYKVNKGNIIAPSFEWNRGNLHLDGYFAYSDSRSYYDSPHMGQVTSFIPTVTSTGNFSAVKGSSSLAYTDWDITQVSGPDWSKTGSYTLSAAPQIRTTSGANAFIYEKSGGLNASYDAQFGNVPITFKAGFKVTDTVYRFGDTSGDNLYTYTGGLSNAAFLAAVTGPYTRTSWDKSNASFTSISGSSYVPMIDMSKLYEMYATDPDEWTHTLTAANYAAANYSNNTRFQENIKAAYGMATAQIGKLKLRAGLRAEWTANTSWGWSPLSATDVKAATVNGVKCAVTASTGIATTIPCVDYQFRTNGYQAIKGDYFKLYPSASAKFTFARSTDAEVGYSRTILRPGLNAIAGSASVDDADKVISVPNPGLTPAMSDNISVRLSHYFKSVGLFTAGFYYNRIDGLADLQEGLSAAEVGSAAGGYADDPSYADYTYTTYRQLGVVSIKGIEVSFQHSLSWLPAPFDGLSVRGGFMHNEPSEPITRVGKNIGSAALMYEKGPVKLFVNMLWNDDKYRSTTPSWFQARTDLSVSGRIKLVKHWEAYFSVNNLLSQPYNVIVPGTLATSASSFPNHSAIFVQNGRTGTFGIRARF
ncbi:outer membrane beta-barrel protein [Sphingomonas sp. NIBR02145]|uniref:outer membrane beta-barrel protein n=1 Tax=Sphingomonas sp. NIBR02145 TaxID=3014784 RepID=UPI0022B57E08|nr:outer membrane beta-barrel protein [Sphingomonas sp. NIBR02145]WHU04534.1 outer membrane beta-barrel protein [Sphingomonas sp. NIBR02145]